MVPIAFIPVSIAIAGSLSLLAPVDVLLALAGIYPPLLALVAIRAARIDAIQLAKPLDIGAQAGPARGA